MPGLGLHIAALPDLNDKTASKVNFKHRGIEYKVRIENATAWPSLDENVSTNVSKSGDA